MKFHLRTLFVFELLNFLVSELVLRTVTKCGRQPVTQLQRASWSERRLYDPLLHGEIGGNDLQTVPETLLTQL